MYKITTFVIFIFTFNNCHNVYKSDLDKPNLCFFNTSWTQHHCNCDLKELDESSLDDAKFICSKHNEFMYKSLTSCHHFMKKRKSDLKKYEKKEEYITISNRRSKRQEDDDNKETEVLIQFLIQVAEYFQLKELLFVIDKTSLIG